MPRADRRRSAALTWQSLQSRVTPYVVEVDSLREARAVNPANVDYRPTDPQIAWHLSRFITNVRSVSLDPVLMRRDWLEAYDSADPRIKPSPRLAARSDPRRPNGHFGTVQPSGDKPMKLALLPALAGVLVACPAVAQNRSAATPLKTVESATRSATVEPAASGFESAAQVYPWSEGTIFTGYAAPGLVTDIALQPGESLFAVASGDTARWVIGDTTSGTGETRQTHVLVKPFSAGLTARLRSGEHADQRVAMLAGTGVRSIYGNRTCGSTASIWLVTAAVMSIVLFQP